MTHEFRLADIGEGLEEAEIVEWRVAVGDPVARDQTLVEVMTDKSNAELPAPVSGIVVALGAAVGDIINVGSLLALIDEGSDSEPGSLGDADPDRSPSGAFARATGPAEDDAAAPVSGRTAKYRGALSKSARSRRSIKASPATRIAAARLGVDLTHVLGSGPGGRVLLNDVEARRHADSPFDGERPTPAPGSDSAESQPSDIVPPSPEPAPLPPETGPLSSDPAPFDHPSPFDDEPRVEPLRGVRRVIASTMARSWSEIPHIHTAEHIDAEPLLELRDQLRSSGRAEFADITPLSMFVAAVASAMDRHRQANASLDAGAETITTHPRVNVGIAVAAPQGLVVPVIQAADRMTLAGIALESGRLVRDARAGTLPVTDFQHGTVTVTNFGSLGGERALPLIRPPESVIFGFGSIASRPFVIDDEVVARSTMHVVLGADHRLIDGDIATAIMRHVVELLTNPINLVFGS